MADKTAPRQRRGISSTLPQAVSVGYCQIQPDVAFDDAATGPRQGCNEGPHAASCDGLPPTRQGSEIIQWPPRAASAGPAPVGPNAFEPLVRDAQLAQLFDPLGLVIKLFVTAAMAGFGVVIGHLRTPASQ